MVRTVPLWLTFVALGCGGGNNTDTADGTQVPDLNEADTDTDADADADTDRDCLATITAVDPPTGSSMVPVDQQVTVSFDLAVQDGDWTLDVIAEGTSLPGTATLSGDGLSVTWAPDANLVSEAPHTVSTTVCDDGTATIFSTLPAPVDPSLIEDNTYALPFENLVWSEPTDPLGFLPTFFPVDYVMVQFVAIDTVSETIDAIATTGAEDLTSGGPVPDCDVSVQEVTDFSSNPLFELGPQLLGIDTTGMGDFIDVEDFELLGRISEDGLTLTTLQIKALVATELMVEGEDCNNGPLVTLLQPNCMPCTTSATGLCMELAGTATLATVQPAIDIASICGL